LARRKVWIYNPLLRKRQVFSVLHEDAVRIKKHSDKEEKRIRKQEDYTLFRQKKFRHFAQKILEFPGVISVREASRITGVNRTTARRYLSILKSGELLTSLRFGRGSEVYLVHDPHLRGGRRASRILSLVFWCVSLFPEALDTEWLPRLVRDALSDKVKIDSSFFHCAEAIKRQSDHAVRQQPVA
jgi:DNA-binding transcriptional ArsR family regulator